MSANKLRPKCYDKLLLLCSYTSSNLFTYKLKSWITDFSHMGGERIFAFQVETANILSAKPVLPLINDIEREKHFILHHCF